MSSPEYYLQHIAAYEREFAKWEGRAEKILKRYRDDTRQRNNGARFNILWSNVQTLKAATFARMPMPDVSRRFKDNDPVGRVAALMIERALEFEVQHYKDFGATIRQCVYDRFLGGRGTAWVRYEPTFKQVQQGVAPDDGFQATEDVDSESLISEELDFECAPVDYVHWRDFGHEVARTWEEVGIIWRRVYMTRTALKERFPDEADRIPLDSTPQELQKSRGSTDTDAVQKRALIYEIWDKYTGKVQWLSKSLSDFVDQKDDPLQLEEFFPCPPPLYATLTTDSLVPLPDFTMYQDQALELDTLSDRIAGLVQSLKMMGVYDASQSELQRLFTEAENGTLIPVKNWAAFAEKQGLKGSIDIVDILPIAQTLAQAYQAFEQVKSQIYELTGISDIVRGDTKASETATAQQIKNSYASMRLKTYQDEVERFAARLLQLKAQIICKHFDAQTICQISACDQLTPQDQQIVPQALMLLKDDISRSFRIDVETDSMVYQNEQQEKADRMEFLQGVSMFLEKAVQAGQQAPELIPLAVDMLKFGVAGFRVGKTLEGTIDQTADLLKQKVAQQQANPQPNPDQMKLQADQQATQMQEQNKAQMQTMQLQHDAQVETMRQQHQAAMEQQKQQHEAMMENLRQQAQSASEQQKLAYQAQSDEMQRAHDSALASQTDDFNRWKAILDNETKLAVAEISAKASAASAEPSDESEPKEEKPDSTAELLQAVNQTLSTFVEGHQQLASAMKQMQEDAAAPSVIIKGPDGKAIGVQKGKNIKTIIRDDSGSILGA